MGFLKLCSQVTIAYRIPRPPHGVHQSTESASERRKVQSRLQLRRGIARSTSRLGSARPNSSRGIAHNLRTSHPSDCVGTCISGGGTDEGCTLNHNLDRGSLGIRVDWGLRIQVVVEAPRETHWTTHPRDHVSGTTCGDTGLSWTPLHPEYGCD